MIKQSKVGYRKPMKIDRTSASWREVVEWSEWMIEQARDHLEKAPVEDIPMYRGRIAVLRELMAIGGEPMSYEDPNTAAPDIIEDGGTDTGVSY